MISYLKDIVFSEDIYAINMLKYTLRVRCTKLHYFLNFLGEHAPIPPSKRSVLQHLSFSQKNLPMFEHGFAKIGVPQGLHLDSLSCVNVYCNLNYSIVLPAKFIKSKVLQRRHFRKPICIVGYITIVDI